MAVCLEIKSRKMAGPIHLCFNHIVNAGGETSVETFHWLQKNAHTHFVRTSDGWAMECPKVGKFIAWAQEHGIEVIDNRHADECALDEMEAT